MTKGISLTFNDDNSASIKENDNRKMCFGGVMCIYSKRKPTTVAVSDGTEIKTKFWICSYVEKTIGSLEKCPLDYWVPMAVPIGHQKRHEAATG
jgi:hypothetical protein